MLVHNLMEDSYKILKPLLAHLMLLNKTQLVSYKD